MSLVIFDGLYGEEEYVDLRTNQQVGGIKTFIDALISMAGFTIRPLVGQGESSMRFQRMSDGTTPQHGDSWVIGQGSWSSARNFVIGSLGGGDDKIGLTIFPDGNIDVGANGRLFSPKLHTDELRLKVNNTYTNVYDIFQRKLTAISPAFTTPLLVDNTADAPKILSLIHI